MAGASVVMGASTESDVKASLAQNQQRKPLAADAYNSFLRDGTKIASRMQWTNFLSAGTIVASAPRNFTRSGSTK
jgi:hypothetical protein